MSEGSRDRSPPPAPALLSLTAAQVAGWVGVLFFFGISAERSGFFIDFRPPYTHLGEGEAHLWLATALLLTPSVCLLGYGYHSLIARWLDRARSAVAGLSRRDTALGLGCAFLVAAALARLANAVILKGYPITDDEWAARFGGQLWAHGLLGVTLPFDLVAFQKLYMFVREPWLTSADWVGTQAAWAISEWTHTGNWVFALSAAVPGPCLAYVVGRRLSPAWGAATFGVFLTIPMAFALSGSTHGHLHSRALLALALAGSVWAPRRRAVAAWALVGLCLGLAITSRFFESVTAIAPFALVHTVAAFRRGGRALRAWAWLVAGAALPLAVLLAHSHAVTGGWLPPRHTVGVVGFPIVETSYWVRFGSNVAFNLLRLAVWFGGPVGVALCVFGFGTDRLTRLLGFSLLSVGALGLAHDNYGVSAVGPIHQSECVVPLLVLAVHGLANLTKRWAQAARPLLAITACWAVVCNGAFNVIHAQSLAGAADIQAQAYEAIEVSIPPEQRPAVVLAPQFAQVWSQSPVHSRRGTWVFDWRRPSPLFDDDVMILHHGAGEASVRRAFPSHHFFRLRPSKVEPFFAVVPDDVMPQ